MRVCPHCRTTYTDDTLQFCLQDGTPLLADQSSSVDESDSETLISPRKWEESQVTKVSTLQPEPKKSNTAKIVTLTVLGMLLLFGLAGAGAWFYLNSDRNETAQNRTKPTNTPNSNSKNNTGYLGNANANNSPKPSPQVSATPTASPTVTPAPDFNPDKVKSEVKSQINNWKTNLEAGDVDAFVSLYADRLDYYFNSNGVGKDAVRSDKERAFSRFDNFKLKISDMRITPDETGEKATAVFDKEWEFEGAESRNAGKVQSQLQLTKIGGQWRITGERDLKVYYTQ